MNLVPLPKLLMDYLCHIHKDHVHEDRNKYNHGVAQQVYMFNFIRCNAFILSKAKTTFQGHEINVWNTALTKEISFTPGPFFSSTYTWKSKIKKLNRWTQDTFSVLIFVLILTVPHSDPHCRAWARWSGPSDWCHRRQLLCLWAG